MALGASEEGKKRLLCTGLPIVAVVLQPAVPAAVGLEVVVVELLVLMAPTVLLLLLLVAVVFLAATCCIQTQQGTEC